MTLPGVQLGHRSALPMARPCRTDHRTLKTRPMGRKSLAHVDYFAVLVPTPPRLSLTPNLIRARVIRGRAGISDGETQTAATPGYLAFPAIPASHAGVVAHVQCSLDFPIRADPHAESPRWHGEWKRNPRAYPTLVSPVPEDAGLDLRTPRRPMPGIDIPAKSCGPPKSRRE